MADNKSPEERSINMSRIRGKNTGPELAFRKWLFVDGYRYRISDAKIPGHPDLWLARYNTVIFVNGCFWHRHDKCKYAYMPKSRVDFWTNKFNNNVARDKKVREELQGKGIRCLVVWECTIKKMLRSEEIKKAVLEKTEAFLHSDEQYLEL